MRVAPILLLAVCGCTRSVPAAAPLRAGDSAPLLIAASAPSRVRVTWIFAGRDLARCRSSARELRHLAAHFGDAVELHALAVGADSGLVRSFFHVQRIGPTTTFVDSATTPGLQRLRWPGLYVVRGARVERVYPGLPFDDDAAIRARDVEPAVASLLGGPLELSHQSDGGGT